MKAVKLFSFLLIIVQLSSNYAAEVSHSDEKVKSEKFQSLSQHFSKINKLSVAEKKLILACFNYGIFLLNNLNTSENDLETRKYYTSDCISQLTRYTFADCETEEELTLLKNVQNQLFEFLSFQNAETMEAMKKVVEALLHAYYVPLMREIKLSEVFKVSGFKEFINSSIPIQ